MRLGRRQRVAVRIRGDDRGGRARCINVFVIAHGHLGVDPGAVGIARQLDIKRACAGDGERFLHDADCCRQVAFEEIVLKFRQPHAPAAQFELEFLGGVNAEAKVGNARGGFAAEMSGPLQHGRGGLDAKEVL